MDTENNPQTPSPGQIYGSQQGVDSSNQSTQPVSQPPHNYDSPNSKKTKKILMVIIGLIGVFVIIAVATLLLTSDKKSQQQVPEQKTGVENLYKEPTAIEIENLNNSVSDDVTNLSADADFPDDKLSDDNLDL